jgi:hypothetical protein
MSAKNYHYIILFAIVFSLLMFLFYYVYCLFVANIGKYTAIIIEPREHKALAFVLNNFLENLDERWNIIVFHGNKNKKYVEKIIDTKLENYKERITLIDLKIDNINSRHEYTRYFLDREFYNYIPTEIFLVFQTDTVICSKYKDLIYDFMDYDYVGAPISGLYWTEWKDGDVGNGGLSLRRKSKMLEILNTCDYTVNEPYKNELEDFFFSLPCDIIENYNKPNTEEAKKFAIEMMPNDKAFGMHKPYDYNNVKEKYPWCPEVIELEKLNKK